LKADEDCRKVVFYLRQDVVFGILWNAFRKINIVRKVLSENKKYDLSEVA